MKHKHPQQPVKHVLNDAGLRCTPGRREIFRLLQNAERPISEKDIQQQLERLLDRTTIYRTLESFLDAGLVHRAFVKDRAWHYELAHHCRRDQCHPHFTCTDCGRTDCLKDTFIPPVDEVPHGYTVKRQQLRLEGLCPRCSQTKTTNEISKR